MEQLPDGSCSALIMPPPLLLWLRKSRKKEAKRKVNMIFMAVRFEIRNFPKITGSHDRFRSNVTEQALSVTKAGMFYLMEDLYFQPVQIKPTATQISSATEEMPDIFLPRKKVAGSNLKSISCLPAGIFSPRSA